MPNTMEVMSDDTGKLFLGMGLNIGNRAMVKQVVGVRNYGGRIEQWKSTWANRDDDSFIE